MSEGIGLLAVMCIIGVMVALVWKDGYDRGKADEQRAELHRRVEEQDARLAASTPPGSTVVGYLIYRKSSREEHNEQG